MLLKISPETIQQCHINTGIRNIKEIENDNFMERYDRTMTYKEFLKSDFCNQMMKEEEQQRLLAAQDKHETLRQDY